MHAFLYETKRSYTRKNERKKLRPTQNALNRTETQKHQIQYIERCGVARAREYRKAGK